MPAGARRRHPLRFDGTQARPVNCGRNGRGDKTPQSPSGHPHGHPMNGIQIAAASAFAALIAFCWVWYFRKDIRIWWVERGPRRQLEAEAAVERQQEVQRLRDELASKYLDVRPAKPPRSGT